MAGGEKPEARERRRTAGRQGRVPVLTDKLGMIVCVGGGMTLDLSESVRIVRGNAREVLPCLFPENSEPAPHFSPPFATRTAGRKPRKLAGRGLPLCNTAVRLASSPTYWWRNVRGGWPKNYAFVSALSLQRSMTLANSVRDFKRNVLHGCRSTA